MATSHRTLNYCKEIVRDRHRTLLELPGEDICAELQSQGVANVKRFTIKKEKNIYRIKHIFNHFWKLHQFHKKIMSDRLKLKLPCASQILLGAFNARSLGMKNSRVEVMRNTTDVQRMITMVLHVTRTKWSGVPIVTLIIYHSPKNFLFKQIQKIKVEKNISCFDGRRQVTVSNDSQPASKRSYAGAAKWQYTSTETRITLACPPASDAPFNVPIPSTDFIIIPTAYKTNLLHQQGPGGSMS